MRILQRLALKSNGSSRRKCSEKTVMPFEVLPFSRFHRKGPNTLKLSYSCMSNVKSIISRHNEVQIGKALNPAEEINDNCNCRIKNSCPLEGNCNVRNIVYQAEVVTLQPKETYIGLWDTTLKERYRNHTCSFRNERYKNVTELSKYLWSLKDRKINYEIKCRKVRQARSYSHFNKKCNVCLWENFVL